MDMCCLQHGNRKQDAPNCVQCYIAEYNVTSEVAIANISQMMEDAWKTKKKLDRGLRLPRSITNKKDLLTRSRNPPNPRPHPYTAAFRRPSEN